MIVYMKVRAQLSKCAIIFVKIMFLFEMISDVWISEDLKPHTFCYNTIFFTNSFAVGVIERISIISITTVKSLVYDPPRV